MQSNEYAVSWKEAAQLPSGFKGLARSWLRNLTISLLALTKGASDEKFLRCIFCHYIFDDQKEQFEKLIIELKKLGVFVDTDTCIDMLDGKREIDGRYFHLSFDDGFRNNLTNALPVLKRQQVPAIFFVPTSLIGADWETTKQYCEETTHYQKPIQMLSWEDLGEMLAAGYEIGSHTKTHSRFADISKNPQRLSDEIAGSKQDLEEKLGKECKYISWPYGSRTDADEMSIDMTKKAGYKACFGAFRGTIKSGTTNKFSIPRHHFEAQWPLSHVTYFAKGNMETN